MRQPLKHSILVLSGFLAMGVAAGRSPAEAAEPQQRATKAAKSARNPKLERLKKPAAELRATKAPRVTKMSRIDVSPGSTSVQDLDSGSPISEVRVVAGGCSIQRAVATPSLHDSLSASVQQKARKPRVRRNPSSGNATGRGTGAGDRAARTGRVRGPSQRQIVVTAAADAGVGTEGRLQSREGEGVWKYRNTCVRVVAPPVATGPPLDCPDSLRVADETPQWTKDVDREFRLRIRDAGCWQVDAVKLHYTRHYWPGFDDAHRRDASATSSDPSLWVWDGAELDGFSKPDSVFYAWEVDYRSTVGGGEQSYRSYREKDLTVLCDPEEVRDYLESAQSMIVDAYDVTDIHNSAALTGGGYTVFPHFNVSLHGAGVGVATLMAITTITQPALSTPAILLYSPRGKRSNETWDAYRHAIRGAQGPPFAEDDGPYRLVGWAYGSLYAPNDRPRLGCVPSKHWFVHEAGTHLASGNMQLTDVDEEVPGASPGPLVGVGPGLWHPRVWDLHLWRGDDGVAQVAINHPETDDIPGLREGLKMPANTFFRSEVFE